MLKMPVAIYLALLGRCPLASREYAVLKNALVHPVSSGDYDVETLCDVSDAELLLKRAKLFYPAAVPYIEQALKSVQSSPAGYRRDPASQTWHFCSNCSQWPTGSDYVFSADLPGDYAICNECIVKNQTGECK
jgi:hypothetical protein